MSALCTVTAVHGSKPWKDGRFVDYTIELDKIEGRHTLTQKPDTAPPTVGQELYGHAEEQQPWPSGDPRPPKFKKDQRPDGFRGGTPQEFSDQPRASSNGSGDPTRDSIEGQTRLKVAGEIVTAMITAGAFTPASCADAAVQTNALAEALRVR